MPTFATPPHRRHRAGRRRSGAGHRERPGRHRGVVHVEGRLGDGELHLAWGQVQLDSVDALQASIAAGEVAIGHLVGRANIDGSRREVWVGHTSAELEVSSASGGVDIDRADGSVTATTASGAIRIGRMTRGHAKLMNGSGDIEVGVSEGATAYVDVNSERGSVRNSVAAPESRTHPSPWSRSTRGRGTATSSFTAQRAEPETRRPLTRRA
jgi:hypothetical protein